MKEVILSGVFTSMVSEYIDVKLKQEIQPPEIEVLVKLKKLKTANAKTLSKEMELPKDLVQKMLKDMEIKKLIQHCSPKYCLSENGKKILKFIKKIQEPMLHSIRDDPLLNSLVLASRSKA